MAKLTLFAEKLTANLEDRTLSGLLLPFNEEGRTNLGRLTATAESRLDVADNVTLNRQHNQNVPLGRAVTLERSPEGVQASFKVLETRDGDDALLEASEGVRCGLSVELDPVVVRGGRIVSGTIVAAAQVVTPAFPSARLAAAEDVPVPDMGDQPATDTADPGTPRVVIDGTELPDVQSVAVTPEEIDITTKTPDAAPAVPANAEQEPAMTAAAVVQNAALVAAQPQPITKNRLFASLVAAQLGGARLQAALSDITPADILGIEQPQYVGELWTASAYERIVIPMFNHGDLTSLKVSGWRFKDGKKPEVSKYLGGKTEVPSNAVETEPVDVDAYRIAGGWDIDRKFRDFSNESFWASFFAAAVEDCKIKSDTYALEDLLDAATVVTPGTVPSGVDPAMAAIVDGIVAILKGTRTLATGALVDVDLWRNTILTRAEDILPMLDAALGFTEGTLQQRKFQIKPYAGLEAGQVLVAAKSAATVHELPGEAPIRVEALDIAKGGIDEGVFAYQAVNIHNAKGLALLEVASA